MYSTIFVINDTEGMISDIYNLRLTLLDIIAIERTLKKSPFDILNSISIGIPPLLEDLLFILKLALSNTDKTYSMEEVFNIYDKFEESGKRFQDLIEVILLLFKDMGFFSENKSECTSNQSNTQSSNEKSVKETKTIEEEIKTYLIPFLSMGKDESTFWHSTFGEVMNAYEAYISNRKRDAERDYLLSQMISSHVANLFSKDNKTPKLEEFYPGLFKNDNVSNNKSDKEALLEKYKTRLMTYTSSTNAKIKRNKQLKEVEEINYLLSKRNNNKE